jgi:hypothetical protein
VISYIIYYAKNYRDAYHKTGVPIHSETIYNIISKNDKSTIFKNLEKWNILKMVRKHEKGDHCQHFKMDERFANDTYFILQLKDNNSAVCNKLKKNEQVKLSDKLLMQQYNIFQNDISLSPGALQWIKDRYQCDYVNELVDNYNNNDIDLCEVLSSVKIEPEDLMLFAFIVKDFFVPTRPVENTRIYTNLTSLRREYRQFLLLEGKPIFQSDLINSQIVFSIPVIEGRIKEFAGRKLKVLPEDFELYKQLAQDGKTYETIAEKMGIVLNCENRTAFKQSFFAGIFFSKNSKRKTAIKKAFEELFPTVANALYSLKQNDYTEFPVKLQKLEASVIIKVLARLNKMGIKALSIHDSIVVNSEAALKIAEELILKS